MSNKVELRGRLREELGDTGSSHMWSDSLLDSLLQESVQWYSRLFPMRATAYRDVAAGDRTFALPPGATGIAQVECPPGAVLPREVNGPIASAGRAGLRQSWWTWGGTLYLGNPAAGDQVGTGRLVMSVLMPWARLDLTEPWDGPEDDERLLVIWAAAEAWAWLDGQDRKRGRSPRPGGMAARYTEELEREVTARKRAATSRPMECD